MRSILVKLAAVAVLATQLAACSNYDGPVSNTPNQTDTNGPPLLTNGFSP